MKYAVILLTLFLTACAVGPTYHRPVVQIPDTFRGPEPVAALEGDSLADLKWFEVFKDDRLQDLIRTALVQNYDLRIAVANVEAERAVLGVTQSNQYPNVAAIGGLQIPNRLVAFPDGGDPAGVEGLQFVRRHAAIFAMG